MGLGEFDRLVDHARTFFLGRGKNHLSAEKTHQSAALDAEAFRHCHDQRITLLGADHGEADARVAAGRLDYRLAGLQGAGFFGLLYYTKCEAILHRAQRIERLNLHEEVHARRRQLADPDNRRIAHRLKNIFVFPPHLLSPQFFSAVQKISMPKNPPT